MILEYNEDCNTGVKGNQCTSSVLSGGVSICPWGDVWESWSKGPNILMKERVLLQKFLFQRMIHELL